MKNLVIVESPTKAKTISKFLGKDFIIKSSNGHVRDLPAKEMGVDIENDFKPSYITIPKAKARIEDLKKTAQKVDVIILATDEDREGEAIAWHLETAINDKGKPSQRIVFHEITKEAVNEALKNPREIDLRLVDAQQARRILDRLVGYELSPFLWKKVAKGLSAGRVQSVAVRIIVDREREIENFKPEEFWSIEADLQKKETNENFTAKLIKKDNKTISKLAIKNKEEADKILKDLENSQYIVSAVERKEAIKNPYPPFKTSTLQQAASNKLGFSTKQTMLVAQQLYEGIELGDEGSVGLITYMRTDSLNISKEAIENTRSYIKDTLGENYLPAKPRFYKTKALGAQEAHEAIRPTFPQKSPDEIKKYLNPNQYKLYNLIWRRMIACQMASAVFDATTVDIKAQNYTFRANGIVIKFDGFLKIYDSKTKETTLPSLQKSEELNLTKILPKQHFTEPPARYTEASLVKALEEEGIGRPSTYAPTISTIQERNYVQKNEEKRFQPTEIGEMVNDLLVKHFPQIVDLKFTAHMEKDLDEIAGGKKEWVPVIKTFYDPFKKNLDQKYKELTKKEVTQEEITEEKCEKCGSPMIIKMGRYGKFLACSNFPKCKNTKPLKGEEAPEKEIVLTEEKCDKCGSPMAVKTGRYGKFLGCSNYPQCKNIKKIIKSTGVKCPQCQEGDIIEKRSKRGKTFYSCSRYPDCKFALWQKPTGEKCPDCSSLLIYAGKDKIKCSNKECGYKP